MVDKLPLPDDFRWLIYEKIVHTLQADPDLKRVIRPRSWHTYSGRPEESAAFASSGYPCIAILPGSGAIGQETPVLQSGSLTIKIDLATAGLSLRNLFNLWGAIERAAFAGQARHNLLGRLQAIYPKTKGVNLTMQGIHAEAAGTDAGAMAATGTVTINYLI